MTDTPNFAARVEELRPEMQEFVTANLAEARTLLALVDAKLAAIRAQGFEVQTRYPINPRDSMSLTRFEVSHTLKFGPDYTIHAGAIHAGAIRAD